MRRIDRLKAPLPDRYKKVDTSINGDATKHIEEQRKKEASKYPLRLDHRTVIYVSKENRNEEYAAKKRIEFGIGVKAEPKPTMSGNPRKKVDVDEVRILIKERMKLKDIAKKMGVSTSTIGSYVMKYKMRSI